MPSKSHSFLEQGRLFRTGTLAGIGGDFPIDKNILDVLPKDCRVISVESFATSDFSITGRFSALLAGGEPQNYFIRCASGEEGRLMLEGEFISITTIEAVVPGLTPETVGSGNFLKNPEIYFMVVEFLELSQDVPDSDKFTDLVIKMHLQGISPNGMFGFSIPTCDGPLAHPVKWEISWVEFFARLLRSGITTDATACGTWAALESAAEQVISKVIPRLLGTLRFEGEPIKPSLIHGDLWDTNIGLDSKTGRIVVYDAGSYYAHNEMELEIWRVIYAEKLGASEYREAYLRKYPPAEPVAEWDDRNRLYSLKYNLNWSAIGPGIATRQI